MGLKASDYEFIFIFLHKPQVHPTSRSGRNTAHGDLHPVQKLLLMRKIKNPWLHQEGYDCFGCSPDNPIGLHMEFYEDGDRIISYWRPQEHLQSWVGVMHGGILATLVDETAGWVITRKLQTTGLTTRLDLRYHHPVRVTDDLTIRAGIREQKRSMVFIDVQIENADGTVCVEGTATYYACSREQAREMGFTHCELEDEQLLPM